jgi:hypothetical protein
VTKLIVILGWPGIDAARSLRPCTTCGEPVDLEVAHYPHRDDCPNRIVGVHVDCDCDLVTHPLCCGECQANGEDLYDALLARALGLNGNDLPPAS